ncbi:DUF4129 domain-containing protein [Ilumatobacter nonamiensis]|uniref:DUF4129 domain-containing protein n=1 Tax=Ilumatobacter nonamiensis TaxID=467093 RepID=UPI0011D2662B|nr:DUF4129 domain-containing protein [Ilumatobacter nonamiensis]
MTAVAVSRFVGPFGPSDVDPDEARDAACEATATSQVCNPPEPDPIDLPEPNLPEFSPPAEGIGVLSQLLVGVLVVALVLAIAWLVYRWWDGRDVDGGDDEVNGGDRDEEIDEPIDVRVIDRETPPGRWRRLAAEHRDSGRFRDSIRCEYRALVGDLARAGYVDEIPGRTSGEERDQVAQIAEGRGDADGDVAEAFDVAADTFDVAWFDDGVVTSDDDDRFLAAQAAVLGTVLAGSRAGRSG